MSQSPSGNSGFILSHRFVIEDPSQIGEGRRQITRLSQDLNFDEVQVGRIAIAFNEIANNLLQHAGKGEIFIREICLSSEMGLYGLEMISIDRGPGMNNIKECLEDGFSTRETPGQGLGAIRRLSQEFDIHSTVGKGTIVMVTFYTDFEAASQSVGRLQSSAICVPVSGETECGDGWAHLRPITGDAIVVSDGLGHGPLASTASREALLVFREQKWRNLEDFIKLAHGRMRSTRGAAISAVTFDTIGQRVHFAGVGNVTGAIYRHGKLKSFVGYPGTVGLKITTVREMSETWEKGDLLILHSDGLSSRWDLGDYPGLQHRSASVVAGVLYRDYCRGIDDSCVWVGRCL